MSYYFSVYLGAVRLPAPLKYAEKANEFYSKYLRDTPRDNLKERPYFI
jgi:argonaute-like protein implicated in RNA metabolism and viral defense